MLKAIAHYLAWIKFSNAFELSEKLSLCVYSTARAVDVRTGKFVHELRTTVVPSGIILRLLCRSWNNGSVIFVVESIELHCGEAKCWVRSSLQWRRRQEEHFHKSDHGNILQRGQLKSKILVMSLN